MIANPRCMSCMIEKQEKQIEKFTDKGKKEEYIALVKDILKEYGDKESAPLLSERIHELYEDFWKSGDEYALAKKQYNELLLSKEEELTKKIQSSSDRIKECIKYACAANYIDFSAVENVNEKTFNSLLEKASTEKISEEEYAFFKADLEKAHTLVYLTDNCGEVVCDKIFIKFLKETYPDLKITVIVRGKNILNDATLENAKEIGLTDLVPCIGNGSGAPGTVLTSIDKIAKETLLSADVIISKGQGNFESLCAEGLNPYYMFLCKCSLFVERFGLKQFSSVFCKEERLKKFKK